MHRLDETLDVVCTDQARRERLKSTIARAVAIVAEAVHLAEGEHLNWCIGPYKKVLSWADGTPPLAFQLAEPGGKYRANEVMAAVWISNSSGSITVEFPYHAGFGAERLWISDGPAITEAEFAETIRAYLREKQRDQVVSMIRPFNLVSNQVLPLLNECA